MGRNLKYQFLNAINSNFKEGMDKHSIKKIEGLGNGKIFSYADRKNLVDVASNFSNHMKEHYPNIKMAKDVKPDHIQSFLNSKAPSCSFATLNQYKSKFNKLENLVNKTYGTKVNYSKGYVVPLTKENTAKVRAVSMLEGDFNKLRNAMSNSNSSAKIAVELSGRFGMRVSETTKLQGRDIDMQKGIISIVDSKGKRSREIPINKENKDFCDGLKSSVGENERLVPIKPDSVNKAVKRGMAAAGIANKYKDAKTGIHSMRKMCAQNHYNGCRASGMSIKQSLSSTSQFLGHGEQRFELMKEYVEDIK